MSAVPWQSPGTPVNTTTVAKTIHQIFAASNHATWIDEWDISFDGNSPTATPIKVEIVEQDGAGTSSAGTLRKLNDVPETPQVTAREAFTGEPATTTVYETHYIHAQSGVIYPYQFHKRYRLKGGNRFAIRVTAPVAVNCVTNIKGEE